ncbi:ABC transporter [Lasiosphaeria hispida]|uniref:ABC transporter n=1 Tax=Lasiosphaeria hispida TaxID=260671 RepID=A0AAJ0HSH5_9PEZI|nr:ABC transporter [Lasiosphaeria hispida]
MAHNSSSFCVAVDDSLGPHANSCRGGFDFTLLFEETILTILPLSLFSLIIPARSWYLSRRERKTKQSRLAAVKLVVWAILAALYLTELVLWAAFPVVRTRASLAAVSLTLISTLGLCILSYLEHTRTVRPSSLLNTFIFFTLLFDITRARTLLLRASDPFDSSIAYVFTAGVTVKITVMVLEALEKRRLLRTEYQDCPPEATAGLYNRSFFWWLNPLFYQGFKRVLDVDDLYTLDKHLEASHWHQKFLNAWSPGRNKSPYSLLKSTFRLLWRPLTQTILPRSCLTALMFCQPFLINRTIRLSQEPINNETTQVGYGLIGAYLFVYVGIAIAMGQYQHRTYRTISMARAGLVSIIYNKTSALHLKDVDPAASMTLMSADMERIVQGWQTMHEIWSNAIEVGVAIYLLEEQLGIACVVPVAVSTFSLLGSLVSMNFIMSRQAMWLEAIEERISATSAMLSSIKGIKMCGLKDTLLDSLQKLRVKELHISKRFRRLIIWNMVFAYFTQVSAPVLTFAVFSLRARNTGNETLDTARVFTALSLFALLSEPLASLVMSLATFLGAVGSFSRIQQFLELDERTDGRQLEATGNKRPNPCQNAIIMHEADFAWDATKSPQLHRVSLAIPRCKFTMVVGPVGCGKTTLLHAILGEIPNQTGSVHIGSASMAYCAQNAWHINGSIRQAILGMLTFDEKWYERVVKACELHRDIQDFPLGDETQIGSGGIALSGGQSHRIALARAVYARKDICVLDDTFSGLDTSTESHVFHSLLGENGLLRDMDTTVLLVSSSAKRLPYSDHIICLDSDGHISGQGTFAELVNAGGYITSLFSGRSDRIFAPKAANDKEVITDTDEYHDDYGLTYSKETPSNTSVSSNESTCVRERETDMNRRTGDVQLYVYYVRSVGLWATLLFAFAIVGFVFSISFPNVWVQWWAAANEVQPNSRLEYWLGVYAVLGFVAIVCLFVSCWQMIITMVPRSGENFHLALLKTVLSAPMSFFVTTDSGVTLNRFSQDLQLIDMELPIAALNTFTTFILCIAQMILIGLGSVYAAVSFPIVLVLLYFIQKTYLRTSRQLRLMDLETKAPLYSLFEESLSGLATIRAFGWQDRLYEKSHKLLDRSQRPFYLLFAVQRWLTLVLDLLVAAIAVLLVVLVVQLRGTVAAGGVGLALLGVIQFSQHVKLLVTFWTTLETHIGSVARLRSFTETTVGEDRPEERDTPPPGWSFGGDIEFRGLEAGYGGTRGHILKTISFTIKAGEKIGVCGRTGSGKTSLIMSLFRIADIHGGAIFVDGVDIATIPRREVRRRIVGIPQQPFLLKGSVRLNADPLGVASDEAIIEALECVQLIGLVEKNGGLDADVDGLTLSNGQKQLFCFARAMLRPGKILVLDEATSSVDVRTEEVIQRLLRKRFAGHTIIAVAHRLDTIMDFDKVAVLDAGRLVEFDSPYSLLDAPGSTFSRLYNSSLDVEEGEDNEAF